MVAVHALDESWGPLRDDKHHGRHRTSSTMVNQSFWVRFSGCASGWCWTSGDRHIVLHFHHLNKEIPAAWLYLSIDNNWSTIWRLKYKMDAKMSLHSTCNIGSDKVISQLPKIWMLQAEPPKQRRRTTSSFSPEQGMIFPIATLPGPYAIQSLYRATIERVFFAQAIWEGTLKKDISIFLHRRILFLPPPHLGYDGYSGSRPLSIGGFGNWNGLPIIHKPTAGRTFPPYHMPPKTTLPNIKPRWTSSYSRQRTRTVDKPIIQATGYHLVKYFFISLRPDHSKSSQCNTKWHDVSLAVAAFLRSICPLIECLLRAKNANPVNAQARWKCHFHELSNEICGSSVDHTSSLTDFQFRLLTYPVLQIRH